MQTKQELPFKKALAIAIFVILLDQVSKLLALTHLQFGHPEAVLPFMNWLLLFNPRVRLAALVIYRLGSRRFALYRAAIAQEPER